jgi:signal transduction histidine kinase
MRLIEEMLQSQRVEAGGLRPQRVALDVAGIARRVVAEMRVGHDRLIEADLPTEDLGLYGDPAGLEHVITNLVDNALKYSPEESVVRVAVFDGDGEVLVTVADEGVGISPEDMPHIFDRFRQASGARGRASVGLGLFIVRSLVEEQGGRVWADSEVGKGTTVTVALPRRRRS